MRPMNLLEYKEATGLTWDDLTVKVNKLAGKRLTKTGVGRVIPRSTISMGASGLRRWDLLDWLQVARACRGVRLKDL